MLQGPADKRRRRSKLNGSKTVLWVWLWWLCYNYASSRQLNKRPPAWLGENSWHAGWGTN
jgi:hypothetical protein